MPIICPIVRTCASKISKVVRESIRRQVDKKSGDLEEEKGAWGSQGGGKDKRLFFPLHSLVLVT